MIVAGATGLAYTQGMPVRTYEEAIAYWYKHVNYEQRGMPADARVLRLDRMRALLAELGHPERRLRILHVAGSKGKGSTCAFLQSILQAAGYRTGLFTSPHLVRVEERCQVNGSPIAPAEVTACMADIESAVQRLVHKGWPPPTFFEVSTALGLLHFHRRRVDWAVVEVGLGGRFDATNVCHPVVSVVTSISLDHTQQLGDTLEKIAFEKAGIIKPSVPAVSGVTQEGPRRVIETVARQRRAPILQLRQDFDYEYEPGRVTAESAYAPRARFRVGGQKWDWMPVGLLGEHQAANAAVALATVAVLRSRGVPIADRAIAQGLRHVYWPARIEVFQRHGQLLVLDCAHNQASMETLVHTLRESLSAGRRMLLLACSRDKDLRGIIQALSGHFQRAVFTNYRSSPRWAKPEALANIWQSFDRSPAAVIYDPVEAIEWALANRWQEETIVITGSVFLAGDLRPELLRRGWQKIALGDCPG
ncbi:MAG: bifunctional folylpolyglutamate synthase/dihydrofolate synthase [Gemmataceae bacterium]